MRLIDADALEKRIEKSYLTKGEKRLFSIKVRHSPTVELPNQLVLRARDDAELEQLKTAWGNGEICFTPIVAYTARPRGEWKFLDHKYYDDRSRLLWAKFKCACCGEIRSFYEIPETIGEFDTDNFCPNCGADMRGEK